MDLDSAALRAIDMLGKNFVNDNVWGPGILFMAQKSQAIDIMLFVRMQQGEQPQERINLLVSRARAALQVWKSLPRRDEGLYLYWVKHLKSEMVSMAPIV